MKTWVLGTVLAGGLGLGAAVWVGSESGDGETQTGFGAFEGTWQGYAGGMGLMTLSVKVHSEEAIEVAWCRSSCWGGSTLGPHVFKKWKYEVDDIRIVNERLAFDLVSDVLVGTKWQERRFARVFTRDGSHVSTWVSGKEVKLQRVEE